MDGSLKSKMYHVSINSKANLYFPNNKPENFSFKIPFPLNEIDTISDVYTLSIKKIKFPTKIKYIIEKGSITYYGSGVEGKIYQVEKVKNKTSLIQSMNSSDSLKQFITYNSESNTVEFLKLGKYVFEGELARVLNLNSSIYDIIKENFTIKGESIKSNKIPDDMFLYLDCVKNSFLDQSVTSLCEIIRSNDNGYIEPHNVQHQIKKYPFNQITFEFKDQNDIPIRFNGDVEIDIIINKYI